MSTPRDRGNRAERLAEHYLRQQGLRLLRRNFHCRRGEIDLVMLDGDALVFIEVRQRRHDRYGSAAESVTRSKQQRIIATASYFLLLNPHLEGHGCRFDVLALSGGPAPRIDWIRDAFQA